MSVAIVGGGLSGLSCGYKLANAGIKVRVFEKEPFLGGLASWYHYEGLNIPKTYHHILGSDIPLLQMIEELGLCVKWQKVRVGFYDRGEIYSFNSPLDLLQFKPLSFTDRLKLGLLFLSARRVKSLEDLKKISIEEWIKREVGPSVYEKFIDPLISAYFGSAGEISAAYLANRWRMESKSITGLLGYLDVSEIITRLEKAILDKGGTVSRNACVQEISIKDGVFVLKVDGKRRRSEYVVSTIPAPILAKIVKKLPQDFERELTQMSYKGCVCVTYWLAKKTSEYYWINILDKDFPFVATFEHANLNLHVRGGVVYAVSYLNEKSPFWEKSDEEIASYFAEYLPKILTGFKEVKHSEVFRSPWATPVFEVGFKNPPITTPIKGLYLAGISRIFPDIRSMGSAIRTGLEAAQEILI